MWLRLYGHRQSFKHHTYTVYLIVRHEKTTLRINQTLFGRLAHAWSHIVQSCELVALAPWLLLLLSSSEVNSGKGDYHVAGDTASIA
jgi:hypothetical protein